MTGADALEKAAKLMSDLRNAPPASIGGSAVTVVRDYRLRKELNVTTGTQADIKLPSSNVLEYVLGDEGSVIVRPSGTEPKVKFYYTAIGKSEADANQLLGRMRQHFSLNV